MPEGIVTPAGPVMGPVGPTVWRRGYVQTIQLAPQIQQLGNTVNNDNRSNRIEQYQTFVTVQFWDGVGGQQRSITLTDNEIPKPLKPGQIVDVILQIKVIEGGGLQNRAHWGPNPPPANPGDPWPPV